MKFSGFDKFMIVFVIILVLVAIYRILGVDIIACLSQMGANWMCQIN